MKTKILLLLVLLSFKTLFSQVPSDVVVVDLGLPSGTLWANMNVGANTPEDYGLYFAWGETVGYGQDTLHFTDWENYSWCEGPDVTIIKYNDNPDYGIIDDKINLDLVDDAAYVNWGERLAHANNRRV